MAGSSSTRRRRANDREYIVGKRAERKPLATQLVERSGEGEVLLQDGVHPLHFGLGYLEPLAGLLVAGVTLGELHERLDRPERILQLVGELRAQVLQLPCAGERLLRHLLAGAIDAAVAVVERPGHGYQVGNLEEGNGEQRQPGEIREVRLDDAGAEPRRRQQDERRRTDDD